LNKPEGVGPPLARAAERKAALRLSPKKD
jgi:hypothetical protein